MLFFYRLGLSWSGFCLPFGWPVRPTKPRCSSTKRRKVRQGWSHPEPFYFYFVSFPLGFLPWVIFLPWAFSHGFSHMSAEKERNFSFSLSGLLLSFFSSVYQKERRRTTSFPSIRQQPFWWEDGYPPAGTPGRKGENCGFPWFWSLSYF